MRRILTIITLTLLSSALWAQRDTVYISTKYTTYFFYSTDISYADLSNVKVIAAKVVDEDKTKLAIKAREPFTTTASLAVEESNGRFHDCIIAYADEPQDVIIDRREGMSNILLSSLDTIHVSDIYTTHIICATDIAYADISAPKMFSGKLVDQGKDKLAIMAREPFTRTANISIEEANGTFHSFIMVYDRNPISLVKDTKKTSPGSASSIAANTLKKGNAPLLNEIINYRQTLFHLETRLNGAANRVSFTCENVFSYSDITYLVFRLKNKSNISFEAEDALFVIESETGSKRKMVNESYIVPKNKYGSLTTPAKGVGKVAYSFEKITLSPGQTLKVYVYETGGSRNLILTLSADDINTAISPFKTK